MRSLYLLFLPRILDLVFALKLRFQQVQEPRRVFADAMEAFESLAEGGDLGGDLFPLRFHLVLILQLFGDAFSLCRLPDDGLKLLPGVPVDVQQVLLELAGQQQIVVQTPLPFLQVLQPHPALFADLPFRLRVHDQIRDQNITDLHIRSSALLKIGLHFFNLP